MNLRTPLLAGFALLLLGYPWLAAADPADAGKASPVLRLAQASPPPGTKRPATRPGARRSASPVKPAAKPAAKKAGGATAAPPSATGGLRKGQRVEFDGRLVHGQTAKSGALYLFARKQAELRSMVLEKMSFRKEVLRTVYPGYGHPARSPRPKGGGRTPGAKSRRSGMSRP